MERLKKGAKKPQSAQPPPPWTLGRSPHRPPTSPPRYPEMPSKEMKERQQKKAKEPRGTAPPPPLEKTPRFQPLHPPPPPPPLQPQPQPERVARWSS